MSPFLDSDTIRPLYDTHDGGPPKGFECRAIVNDDGWWGEHRRSCGRVTRTLRGMIAHQRIVHGVKQQGELNFAVQDSQAQQNG